MVVLNKIGQGIKYREVLFFLLIIILGAFLRIYELDIESIWLDEAYSIWLSSQNITTVITQAAVTSNHPPFYFILLHYWMNFLGDSELIVRSLSALFGIVSLYIIYLIGNVLFSRKVGIVASLISAISIYHIHYAQEARSYSLLLVLSLLSFFFFIKILKANRGWYYLIYFFTNLLLVYTHVYGLFIIASQALYFLLFWQKYERERVKFLGTLIAIILFLVPLVLLLGTQVTALTQGGFWIGEPSLRSIYDTLWVFAGESNLLVLVFTCSAILALISLDKTAGKWRLFKPIESLKSMNFSVKFTAVEKNLLLIIWLILPIVSAFVISKITTPIYTTKYLIEASPALYLLVAEGIARLKIKKLIYPVLLSIFLLSIPGLVNYYKYDQKEQWREVVGFVRSYEQTNDAVLFCASYVRKPFDYYYQGELEGFEINMASEDQQELDAQVNEVAAEKNRLWLILSHCSADALIEDYLVERYGKGSILKREAFVGVRVLLFNVVGNKSR